MIYVWKLWSWVEHQFCKHGWCFYSKLPLPEWLMEWDDRWYRKVKWND